MTEVWKCVISAMVAVSLLPSLCAAQPATPLVSAPTDQVERIIQFTNSYEGGDCFFVRPVDVTAGNVMLEAYGSSAASFEVLGTEFKVRNGFEAEIEVHKITSAQCAAVNFLSLMRNGSGMEPRLDLVSTVVPPVGNMLTGTVTDFGNRNVDLLMVADDGLVYNLTNRLSGAGDTKSFSVFMRQVSPGPARPQLALAVANSKPLAVLNPSPQLGRADQVFAQVLAEIQQGGQSVNVSVKYFLLLRNN